MAFGDLLRHVGQVPGHNRLDNRIRTRDTAEEVLGANVLAEVPLIPREDRGRLVDAGSSPLVEAYRGLSFSLISKPVGLTRSPSVAAWTFRVSAALSVLAATWLVARRRAVPAALVGWNPVVAIHFAGGGHNDAFVVSAPLYRAALEKFLAELKA